MGGDSGREEDHPEAEAEETEVDVAGKNGRDEKSMLTQRKVEMRMILK